MNGVKIVLLGIIALASTASAVVLGTLLCFVIAAAPYLMGFLDIMSAAALS